MTTHDAAPDEPGLDVLFEESVDPEVHTSAAAETGFVLGLAAVASVPFSLMHAVSLALGAVAVVCSFVGMVTTSNSRVAGRLLVPLGLALGAVAVLLVSVRYAGVDTAFGDDLRPSLLDWLEDLNARFGPR